MLLPLVPTDQSWRPKDKMAHPQHSYPLYNCCDSCSGFHSEPVTIYCYSHVARRSKIDALLLLTKNSGSNNQREIVNLRIPQILRSPDLIVIICRLTLSMPPSGLHLSAVTFFLRALPDLVTP